MEGVCQIKVITGTGANITDASAARRAAYLEAISGVMRSDPDVLMIGEMRYPEAVEAALQAALSGHNVFATIHAMSALGIIRRMQGLLATVKFAEPMEFLCDEKIISGLSHQRLVPVLCPHCKIPYLEAKNSHKLHFDRVMPTTVDIRLSRVADLGSVFVRGEGCEKCSKLGFNEQTVASEVIVTNYELFQKFRIGGTSEAYNFWINSMKGKTYIQDAIDKINSGILDPYMTEKKIDAPLDSIIYGDKQYSAV
jgi:type II secretory ATPase GspE/PulE/Tfp pilus assembly ATPase PilB-like protein